MSTFTLEENIYNKIKRRLDKKERELSVVFRFIRNYINT